MTPKYIKSGICYRKGWQHSFLEAEKVEDGGIAVVLVVIGAIFLFSLSFWIGAITVVGSIVKLIWDIHRAGVEERKSIARYDALGPTTRYLLDKGYTLKDYKS